MQKEIFYNCIRYTNKDQKIMAIGARLKQFSVKLLNLWIQINTRKTKGTSHNLKVKPQLLYPEF